MKKTRRMLLTAAVLLLFTLFCTSACAEEAVLVLPQALTEIEAQAFYGDTSIVNVIPPQGIQKIGSEAFAGTSLQRIILPWDPEIADNAFSGTHIQCLVALPNSPAGHWAEEHGIPVAFNNNLELYPRDGWRICVERGESAELAIDGFNIAWNYDNGAHLEWYLVTTDDSGSEHWQDLKQSGMTLTTDPVYGHMRYVCRIRDAFDLRWDGWFDVNTVPENSAVSAGSPNDISSTGAWVPLTYSVTANLAEQGYRMGVFYSESRSAVEALSEGEYPEDAFSWTWGGESDVFGPANSAAYDGYLDEMIPGHTYYYRACIEADDGRAIVLGDEICSFTTLDGSDVPTLTPNQHGNAARGHEKAAFRFVLPADGIYTVNASVAMNEMAVRSTDDRNLSRARDTDRVSFFGQQGEEVYLFTRNFESDAELWVSYAGAVPTQDAVDASLYLNNDGTLRADITLTVTPDTAFAEQDYGYCIMYSPYESFEDADGNFVGDDLFWEGGDHLVHLNETIELSYLRKLLPGTQIYYCGVIDCCNGESIRGETHTFTVPGAEIPALTLNAGWANVPADTSLIYSFTPTQAGFYAFEADGMHDFVLLRGDGSTMRGINRIEREERHAVLICGMRANETCYVRFTGDGTPRIRVYPAENAAFALSSEPQWIYDNHFARFTAPETGWYNVQVDNVHLIDHVAAYFDPDQEAMWFRLRNDADKFSLYLEENASVYLITWYDDNQDQVFMRVNPISAPNQDSVASVLAVNEQGAPDIGSTWVNIDITYSATEETVEDRYFVGVAFSQDRRGLEQLDDRNHFIGDTWRWEELSAIAVNEHIVRHIDQLIPDKTYYYRPVITKGDQVVVYGEIQQFHTAVAGDELITMRPFSTIRFSGSEVTPVVFRSKEESGFRQLSFNGRPVGQADVRREDGFYYLDGSDCETLTFYAEYDTPIYFFLRNWEGEGSVTLSDQVTPAPTEDFADAEIFLSQEDNNYYFNLSLSISPETAAQGYVYRLELSPFENFRDENGNDRIDCFFQQYGDNRVRLNESSMIPVPLAVPGSVLYYRACIGCSSGDYIGDMHSFTVPNWDVPALTLTDNWTDLEENTPCMFKFSSPQAGFFGIEAEGVRDLVLFDVNGMPVRGISGIEHEQRYAFLITGFDPNDTVYIRVRGDQSPRLRVVPAAYSDFTLSAKSEWIWDNHYVRFTAPESGWYDLALDQTSITNHVGMAWNSVNDQNAQQIEFRNLSLPDGVISIYIPQGKSLYFITWYDMDQGQVQMSMTKVNSPGSNRFSDFQP